MAWPLNPALPLAGSRALSGLRIVWIAAPGPAALGTMLLADLGADVIRIDRPSTASDLTGVPPEHDPRSRGQRGIGIDLKADEGLRVARELVGTAHVFIEGMRPGAAERLGLGPDELHAVDPSLIYARMTGWGQTGPAARAAGHDINYLAGTGALHAIGTGDSPIIPLNLLADFGGGSTYLVVGILAALIQRSVTGAGQVIDCAMIDGVASLTSMIHAMRAQGLWTDERESNLLDGGAPFYTVYRAGDGHVAVGSLEPKFYRALLHGVGLDPEDWPQLDRSRWPGLRDELSNRFARHDRSHWVQIFAGTDACVSQVLSFSEAVRDPHLNARNTLVRWDGLVQPGPAPRLGASPIEPASRSARYSHTDVLLQEIGRDRSQIKMLRQSRAVV